MIVIGDIHLTKTLAAELSARRLAAGRMDRVEMQDYVSRVLKLLATPKNPVKAKRYPR